MIIFSAHGASLVSDPQVQASLSKSRAALDSLVTTVHDRLRPRPPEASQETLCMDGPTTLTHLRKDPRTADIPVLFMTARAQAREVDQFIALGAQGVISKPFDPMTLAFAVRSHLQAIRLEALRMVFVRRAKSDAALLTAYRSSLGPDANAATFNQIREIAHGLAGAAGLFRYHQISDDAAAVEEAALAEHRTPEDLTDALDCLLSCLEGDWDAPPAKRAQFG